MFRADRPRIRDVDVEVVASGGDGVVEPPEIHEPPIEAPNNGAQPRALRAFPWKRSAPPSSSAEMVLDAEVETIEPVETPPTTEPALFETAIAESPEIEIAPPSEPTLAEAETPASIEKPPTKPRRRRRTRAKTPRPEPASDVVPTETAESAEPAADEPIAAEPDPAKTAGAAEAANERARPEKPSSRPRRRRSRAKEPGPESASDVVPQETAEPAEAAADEPAAAESEPAEAFDAAEAAPPTANGPEVPPSRKPRPNARVVWSSAGTGVQRAHTLRLTKPAPSRGVQGTPAIEPEPRAKPPVEKPRAAAPPPPAAPAGGLGQDATTEAEPALQRREPQPPAFVQPPAHETPAAPAPPSEQTCDILFWRGYRKAAFYAQTFDETGEAVAVAESPFFRPQGSGAPEPTEAAKAAYEALRSQLLAAGWEPVSGGDEWFEETFRLTAAPEPEPE